MYNKLSSLPVLIALYLTIYLSCFQISESLSEVNLTTPTTTTTNNARKVPHFRKLKISSFNRHHNGSSLTSSPTNATLNTDSATVLPSNSSDQSKSIPKRLTLSKWNSSRLFSRRQALHSDDSDLVSLENNLEFSKFALPYHDKKKSSNKKKTNSLPTSAAGDSDSASSDSRVTLIPFQIPFSQLQKIGHSENVSNRQLDLQSNQESSWNPITYINPVGLKLISEQHSRRPPMIELSGTSLSQLYALPPLSSALPMNHFHTDPNIFLSGQPLSMSQISSSAPYSQSSPFSPLKSDHSTNYQNGELRRQDYTGLQLDNYPEMPPHHQSQYYHSDPRGTTPVYQHSPVVAPVDDYLPGTMGKPWKDYPIFSHLPATNFVCPSYGFYADVEAGCQMWHYCQPDGRHDAFLCTNGTLFNQATRVCDWWYNVDCRSSIHKYGINQDLYRVPANHKITGDHLFARLSKTTPIPYHTPGSNLITTPTAGTPNSHYLLGDNPSAHNGIATTNLPPPNRQQIPLINIDSDSGAVNIQNLHSNNQNQNPNQYSAILEYPDPRMNYQSPQQQQQQQHKHHLSYSQPTILVNQDGNQFNHKDVQQSYGYGDEIDSDNFSIFKMMDIERKKKK